MGNGQGFGACFWVQSVQRIYVYLDDRDATLFLYVSTPLP